MKGFSDEMPPEDSKDGKAATQSQQGHLLREQDIKVLDMCSAPGGKTCALLEYFAELVSSESTTTPTCGIKSVSLTALDRSYSKIRRVQKLCQKALKNGSCGANAAASGKVHFEAFRADSAKLLPVPENRATAAEEEHEDRGEETKNGNVACMQHEHEQKTGEAETSSTTSSCANVHLVLDNKKAASGCVVVQRKKNPHVFYHKKIDLRSDHWQAFYQVLWEDEKRDLQDSVLTRKKSEKKFYKAILARFSRDRSMCSREHVDAMMRLHNNGDRILEEARRMLATDHVQEHMDKEDETVVKFLEQQVKLRDQVRAQIFPPRPLPNSANASSPPTTATMTPSPSTSATTSCSSVPSSASSSSKSPTSTGSSRTSTSSSAWLPEGFDFILCDVPCTAMGQKPLLSFPLSYENDVLATQQYQRGFLRQAFELAKVGGEFVFSTCTLTLEENEENVAWLLQAYAGRLELVDLRKHFGGNIGTLGKNKQILGKNEKNEGGHQEQHGNNSEKSSGNCVLNLIRRDDAQEVYVHDDERLYGFQLEEAPDTFDRRFVMRFDPRYWDLGFFVSKFRKIAS
ncbi:unnamed protein product [Amoebophrya sp. A25]|nr:unnamed protein product [Amoebophrya sp. A25]|eukprot:GSA25T00008251001.1